MAVTTATASLALSTVVPMANHVNNILSGTFAFNDISASASGIAWLAALPPNAKRVQMIVKHVNTGAATAVLNYGYLTQNGSLSASAIAGSVADATVHISTPIDFTPDDANNERRRHITASRVSGTATASLLISYMITYGF